ncbi:MAG: YggS family pyridoxal phosphate-dependent enzyme [Gammaproteobacteria bacterium HGW-Gammaproteobacteria-14]|nr:MAG: YggS family pyridoxal phosphate-dependent enzyme [Gammaproteobacteria bacterium HGW-Gammaproteobacteria-14]
MASLRQACEDGDRSPDSVTLIAVSKTRGADEVAALAALGQRQFAENYLQEALEKMDALAAHHLHWHFIGPIQSNKTREIASRFDWVHSLDRDKIARRLNDQRPAGLPPLNVCIQINVDDETSKAGVSLDQVAALAQLIHELPRLRLRGLMAIPRPDSKDRGRAAFRTLAMTLSSLGNTIPNLDTLSMGMSDDFDVAIEEGATHIRIGTALFGARPARQ